MARSSRSHAAVSVSKGGLGVYRTLRGWVRIETPRAQYLVGLADRGSRTRGSVVASVPTDGLGGGAKRTGEHGVYSIELRTLSLNAQPADGSSLGLSAR